MDNSGLICYDEDTNNFQEVNAMSNAELSQEQIDKISRAGIKKLIEKYNQSQGKDKQSLSLLLEQLAKTPMYFAVQKNSTSSAMMNFITLTVNNQVFIPIFTSPEDFGKLKDQCECVCLKPMDYFQMLVDNNRHAVVNPFGTYFLLWPELVRDHMLPYMKQAEDFERAQKEQKGGFAPIS